LGIVHSSHPPVAGAGPAAGPRGPGLPEPGGRFEVERFESVAAGRGVALLRLAGRWRGEANGTTGRPVLIVDDGRASHRLAALPEPEGQGDPWRAAFSAPADLLSGERLAFALDAGGETIRLPAPAEHALRPADERAAPARTALEGAVTELSARLAEAEERAAHATEAAAAVRRRELEVRRARTEMERRAEDLADRAANRIAAAEVAGGEGVWAARAEVEAQAAASLAELQARARELERELEGAREAAARREAEVRELRRAAEAREAQLQALLDQIPRAGQAGGRVAALEREARALEERAAALEAEARGAFPPAPASPARRWRRRPADRAASPPAWLPAEWAFALVLMGVGVVLALLILSGKLF
jgi:hypothetical protein